MRATCPVHLVFHFIFLAGVISMTGKTVSFTAGNILNLKHYISNVVYQQFKYKPDVHALGAQPAV
jgi:hypothetical protein